MTNRIATLNPITVTPGVQPSTDKTALATEHYTFSDKIRFRFGYPEKIGGWIAVLLAYSLTIKGIARSLFSAVLSTSLVTLVGTSAKVYSLFGSILTNITPLSTTTNAIPSSLSSTYETLAANPIATVLNSNTITVTDAFYGAYISGDPVTLAGATATGGFTTGQLNAQHVINNVFTGGYTIALSSKATSTGNGGGSSVVAASGLVQVITPTAHGMSNGDRTKIASATTFAGLTNIQLNGEFLVRAVSTNAFYYMTVGTATSHVTASGGTGTTYQTEIPGGAVNESFGQGYGMGLYGIGLYGTALLSTSSLIIPRIWFFDRYGSTIIMTPGNQGGLYQWAGSDAVAPVLVANAPTAINYAFVSNNIVVTLGAGGIVNRVFSSDQGGITTWTASSSNQVFDQTVVGAGQWKSHVSVAGSNLLFTDNQTYLFAYLGYTAGVANAIWNIQQLEPAIGLIAPMARVAVEGTAYWMGQNNFYMWNGGTVQVIPANTQTASTLLKYVFKNINRGQSAKCFAWYNELYDEIWFHYPSAGSNECDRVARLNRTDLTWCPDTFDRTCAEYPSQALGYPRLIDSSSVIYQHEQGTDANGSAMTWQLETNLRGNVLQKNLLRMMTDKNAILTGFVPDSVQTAGTNITVEVIGQRYPQSPELTYDQTYTIAPDTEMMPIQSCAARLWKYLISGSALGQGWIGGAWHEWVQEGPKQ